MARYLAMVGRHCAGKDTFADYAKAAYGIPAIRSTAILADAAVARGLLDPAERADKAAHQAATAELQRLGGIPALLDPLIAAARSHPAAVITHINGYEYCDYYRDHLGDVLVIGIRADPAIRCARALQSGIVHTPEEFEELERHPMDAGVGQLLAEAAIHIVNNSDLPGFYRSINQVLTSLGFTPAPRAAPLR